MLRLGHALAEQEGVAVHFSQQNAEATDSPEGHLDLIVSSFFFHEVALPATWRILKECWRLLAPGDVMVHMGLPNETTVGHYDNFFWNWGTRHNNEPNYTVLREQDPRELCSAAGFRPETCFAQLVPDIAGFGTERYSQFQSREIPSPPHGLGGWFAFGAEKNQFARIAFRTYLPNAAAGAYALMA